MANCYRDAQVGDTTAECGMQTGSESLALPAASKMVAGGLPAHFNEVIIVIVGVGPRTPIHHHLNVRRLGALYRSISSPLCRSCSFGPHCPPPFAALLPRGRTDSHRPHFEPASLCCAVPFFIVGRRRALPPRCAPGRRPASIGIDFVSGKPTGCLGCRSGHRDDDMQPGLGKHRLARQECASRDRRCPQTAPASQSRPRDR